MALAQGLEGARQNARDVASGQATPGVTWRWSGISRRNASFELKRLAALGRERLAAHSRALVFTFNRIRTAGRARLPTLERVRLPALGRVRLPALGGVRPAIQKRMRLAVISRRRIVMGTIASAGAALALSLAVFLVMPLPPAAMPEGSDVYAVNGERIARLYVEDRTLVPLSEVSPYLIDAVLAFEDRYFFSHRGVNPGAVARALWQAVQNRRIVSGFSTITQQLARNHYLSADKTVKRKLTEVLWALRIEVHRDKEWILESYLNEVYWGHGVYGAQEASRTYFGCDAKDLSLAQAAMLAGLLQSPENFTPYRQPELALRRRDISLGNMVRAGRITEAEAGKAAAEPLKLAGLRPRREATYFVQYCVAQITAKYPELAEDLYRRNYQIYTTLDPRLQASAEAAVTANLPAQVTGASGTTQPQVALVAIEPATGYLKAMIGGRSYAESQFNRAVDARRQPGSTIKPLIYALALEAGYSPLSTQHCTETNFAPAGTERYAPRDHGTIPYHEAELTMRRALAESCNVTALAWLQTVGAANVVDLARRTGIRSPLAATPSLALGSYEVSPLEMAGMYATFAAGGVHQQPVAVLRLVGPDGKTIDEHKSNSQRAMSSGAAYIVTDMLKGVLQPGGTGARIGSRLTRPAAAKTGSTDGSRDAWFAGYTPDLALVVWVGHDDNAALTGGGAALAGPIWRDSLEQGLPATAKRDFTRPGDVVTAHICDVSGRLTNWTCQGGTDLFVAGSAPAEYCGLFHWGNVLRIRPGLPGTPSAPSTPSTPGTPGTQPQLPARRPRNR